VALPKRIEENKRSSGQKIHCHVSDHAIAGMCPIVVRLPPVAAPSTGHPQLRWRGLHHHPPSSPSPLDPTTPPPLIRSPHDIGVYPSAALRHCHRCSPFTSALSSRVGPRQGVGWASCAGVARSCPCATRRSETLSYYKPMSICDMVNVVSWGPILTHNG
jgi:hypothetical protein